MQIVLINAPLVLKTSKIHKDVLNAHAQHHFKLEEWAVLHTISGNINLSNRLTISMAITAITDKWVIKVFNIIIKLIFHIINIILVDTLNLLINIIINHNTFTMVHTNITTVITVHITAILSPTFITTTLLMTSLELIPLTFIAVVKTLLNITIITVTKEETNMVQCHKDIQASTKHMGYKTMDLILIKVTWMLSPLATFWVQLVITKNFVNHSGTRTKWNKVWTLISQEWIFKDQLRTSEHRPKKQVGQGMNIQGPAKNIGAQGKVTHSNDA